MHMDNKIALVSELTHFIDQTPVIDGHEHLFHPRQRVQNQTGFYDLTHYVTSDLISAGMDTQKPMRETFWTHFPHVRHTGYGRMMTIMARELYGIECLDETSAGQIDAAVRAHSKDIETARRWYETVFKRCNIVCALKVMDDCIDPDPVIKLIGYLDYYMKREHILYFLDTVSDRPHTLDAYIQWMRENLKKLAAKGMLAGKFALPYWHTLSMVDYDRVQAEAEFSGSGQHNPHFEAFVFHQLVDALGDMGLPVQCHTGHVEPSATNMAAHDLSWCDPGAMGAFAWRHPKTKIILLHTGFPYRDQWLSIIKSTPNLYADFSWAYVISPVMAQETLRLAVDMLPTNKLIGFGGDAMHVEAMAGHWFIARQAISQAFARMVTEGVIDLSDAQRIIRAMLHDNPKRIYSV